MLRSSIREDAGPTGAAFLQPQEMLILSIRE
jgi:hypothetical protein